MQLTRTELASLCGHEIAHVAAEAKTQCQKTLQLKNSSVQSREFPPLLERIHSRTPASYIVHQRHLWTSCIAPVALSQVKASQLTHIAQAPGRPPDPTHAAGYVLVSFDLLRTFENHLVLIPARPELRDSEITAWCSTLHNATLFRSLADIARASPRPRLVPELVNLRNAVRTPTYGASISSPAGTHSDTHTHAHAHPRLRSNCSTSQHTHYDMLRERVNLHPTNDFH
jgi:hypothetical protein